MQILPVTMYDFFPFHRIFSFYTFGISENTGTNTPLCMLVARITSHSHDPLGPRGPLDPGRPLVPGGPAKSAGSPGSPAGPFSPDSPFIPNGPKKCETDRENGNVLFLAFGLNSVLKQFFKC